MTKLTNQPNKISSPELSFWEHLEELRWVILKSLAIVLGFSVVVFCCKELIFKIIFLPSKSDFITFRLMCSLGNKLGLDLCMQSFDTQLINTQLASQFLIHISTSFYIGIMVACPYIIYLIFRFISPALYATEQKYSSRVVFFSILLFFFGVLFNYFIIFPLSFRFLYAYQVSENVANMIALSSYIDTLFMLSILLGIMSELPILAWLLAKFGFISAKLMKKYRRHVVVAILIIAAVITPTADIFTMFIVFLPIYLFYELSIIIVKKSVSAR